MDIIYKSIDEITPYGKNPRLNDAAVEQVAESIRQFGFLVPCVIDRDGVLVTGHTRYKAAKKLGISEIPCVTADGLTDKQIKAFRLVDNKVSEKAKWNFDILREELNDLMKVPDVKVSIPNIKVNIEPFGFKIPEPRLYHGDERERTYNRYNLDAFDSENVSGKYQMPQLLPCYTMPDELISFNYLLTSKKYGCGVHFYIDDYQFERIWDRPEPYIEKLQKFKCALTPDFSLYTDMPMSMKIWNVYRSRLIGQMMQYNGIDVIPTVSWAEPETFEFCFDGLPHGAILSVSTIGVKRDEVAFKIWIEGMDEMIRRCEPRKLLVYGGKVGYDYGDIEVKYISNGVTERMADRGR